MDIDFCPDIFNSRLFRVFDTPNFPAGVYENLGCSLPKLKFKTDFTFFLQITLSRNFHLDVAIIDCQKVASILLQIEAQ